MAGLNVGTKKKKYIYIVRKILKVFSEFPKKVAKMHALVSVIP